MPPGLGRPKYTEMSEPEGLLNSAIGSASNGHLSPLGTPHPADGEVEPTPPPGWRDQVGPGSQ